MDNLVTTLFGILGIFIGSFLNNKSSKNNRIKHFIWNQKGELYSLYIEINKKIEELNTSKKCEMENSRSELLFLTQELDVKFINVHKNLDKDYLNAHKLLDNFDNKFGNKNEFNSTDIKKMNNHIKKIITLLI